MRELEDLLPYQLVWQEQFNACIPREECDRSAGLGTSHRPEFGSATSPESSAAVAAKKDYNGQQTRKASRPTELDTRYWDKRHLTEQEDNHYNRDMIDHRAPVPTHEPDPMIYSSVHLPRRLSSFATTPEELKRATR